LTKGYHLVSLGYSSDILAITGPATQNTAPTAQPFRDGGIDMRVQRPSSDILISNFTMRSTQPSGMLHDTDNEPRRKSHAHLNRQHDVAAARGRAAGIWPDPQTLASWVSLRQQDLRRRISCLFQSLPQRRLAFGGGE
jgi:hypothetical protein